MRKIMHDMAEEAENAPYVSALCRIKGIDIIAAMTVIAEFCTFERFTSGRKVSSWLGCVPKNASSGEKDAHGPITKAGNKHLRRTLVEAIGTISTWKDTSVKFSDEDIVSPDIEHIARNANVRLKDKYIRLTKERAKHTNKAKVAVVNELVRWCWVIGLEVQSATE